MASPSSASVPALPADIEAIKILNQHWMNDNNVINSKLVQYIAVQSLLVLAREKVSAANELWPVLGILSSVCWFFSMGRTYGLRELWRKQAEELVNQKPGLGAFRIHEAKVSSWYGVVSTGWTQIGIPFVGFVLWVFVALRMFIRNP